MFVFQTPQRLRQEEYNYRGIIMRGTIKSTNKKENSVLTVKAVNISLSA